MNGRASGSARDREDRILTPADRAPAGPLSRAYAWTLLLLRWLVVPAWIVAAVAAVHFLPSLEQAQSGALGSLVPTNAPALKAEERDYHLFDLPLLSRVEVVQRNPHGLSLWAQARAVERAVRVDTHADPRVRDIPAAVPVSNTLGLFPGSAERSTTVVTYLYFKPDTTLEQQWAAAHRYLHGTTPQDAVVGVTGAAPARLEQTNRITRALPWIEVATVLMIGLVVGLYYRSVGAPVVTLAAAALAYVISTRVVAWFGERLGVTIPNELEPLLVVLLLGIVTDYSVFFLSGMRDRLRAGEGRGKAARWTTATFTPIILVAGLTVAAGTASLLVARLGFLRAFGPGLAFTVLIGLAVAVTFVPAMLGMFGRVVFWPRWPPKPGTVAESVGEPSDRIARSFRSKVARWATARPAAAAITILCVLGLGAAAAGLTRTSLGFTLIQGLPGSSEVRQAADAASQGFAPGILDPTIVLVQGTGLEQRTAQLTRLQSLIGRQRGVAGVLGPAQLPPALKREVQARTGRTAPSIFVNRQGSSARYVVILADDPLSADGMHAVQNLQRVLPALGRRAGVGGVRFSLAGDTAIASETIQQLVRDFYRVAALTLAIDLVLLVVFLRSLVAPFFLLAASVLALAAAIGLTTLLFQRWLGQQDLGYYVPYAAAVLLVSLGSDYNIFVVGRIWEEARRLPLRDAIASAAPRASRTIAIAGVTLALSFAVLAMVNLMDFRELAFAMFAGILIDTFVVRSLLVPSLISLFGRTSGWPWARLADQRAAPREPLSAAA
jgi:RND superfamily putative drug exporter